MLSAATSFQRWLIAILAFLPVFTVYARSVHPQSKQSLSGFDNGELSALATGNPSLFKRQGDNLVVNWADRGDLLDKGNRFQIWLQNDYESPQSSYYQYDELAKQGWRHNIYVSGEGDEDEDNDEEPTYTSDISDALQGLGTEPDNWAKIGASHENNWVVDGVEYEATGAEYQQVVYPDGGILDADVNFSPAASSYGTRPTLERWSDVAFLQWQYMCARFDRSVRDLSGIVRVHIVNRPTAGWIIAAVKNYDSRMGNAPRTNMPTWQNRITFSMDTEEARVLLGTPNGSGGGFLLNTHKDQLGLKRFSEVIVWDYHGSVMDAPRENMGLCLAFIVQDV